MEKIDLIRYIFNSDVRSTIGDLLIDDEYFCFTLEDEIRADGVKVYGKTAIPAGNYKVKLTYSPKYQKQMPLIYNKIDDNGNPYIEGGKDENGKPIKWSGVRFHGGNTEKDSLGCPLVAFNTDGKKIWGSASKKLTALFEEGKEYDLIISNQPFTYKGRHQTTAA